MGYSIDAAIRVASSEVGTRETGTNDVPYNRWLGRIPGYPHGGFGYPWCQSFQSWVGAQAGGRPGTDFPRTAGCLAAVKWFKQRGRWSTRPHRGDWVYYGPSGGTHVEMVIDVSGSSIVTIGGNTSGSLNGNYFNGDGVYRKTVARSSSRIYGYGRPLYGDATPYKWDGKAPAPTIQAGAIGPHVRDLQHALMNAGEKLPRFGVDGDFGDETAAAVKGFQRRYGLVSDAIYGPNTAAALRAVLAGKKPPKPSGGRDDAPSSSAPQWPGRYLTQPPMMSGSDVRTWQARMKARGWRMAVDGVYGPASESICRAFQAEKRLGVDGIVGPKTWAAAWTAPIT